MEGKNNKNKIDENQKINRIRKENLKIWQEIEELKNGGNDTKEEDWKIEERGEKKILQILRRNE